jgi:hypothetical protein
MYSVILGEPAISPNEKIRMATRVNNTFCEHRVRAIPMEQTVQPDIIDFSDFKRMTRLDTAIWRRIIYIASRLVTNSASMTPGTGL